MAGIKNRALNRHGFLWGEQARLGLETLLSHRQQSKLLTNGI